ncbi:MAG: nucleoside-diphosphate kinase [Thermoproteus sp.]|jgi:nucleoside-diphosphate kinase
MIERTLVIIKPDAVKRGLIGEIISRLERAGLRIVAAKMVWASREQMAGFYPSDEAWLRNVGNKTLNSYREMGIDPKAELGTDDPVEIGKMVKGWLVDYMTEAPILLMVVEGNHAVSVVRKLVGNTLPYKAEPGTIRGDFSTDSPDLANRERRSIRNLVHASDSPEEARREIAYWFKESEIYSYR